jgi:hypothetical protein
VVAREAVHDLLPGVGSAPGYPCALFHVMHRHVSALIFRNQSYFPLGTPCHPPPVLWLVMPPATLASSSSDSSTIFDVRGNVIVRVHACLLRRAAGGRKLFLYPTSGRTGNGDHASYPIHGLRDLGCFTICVVIVT